MSHPLGTDYDPPPLPPEDLLPAPIRKILGVLAVVVGGTVLFTVCGACAVAYLLCGRDGCL